MPDTQDILLVYDKECPACNYYCNLARIRASVGNLVLINARDDSPVMREITAADLDIDQGMALKVAEKLSRIRCDSCAVADEHPIRNLQSSLLLFLQIRENVGCFVPCVACLQESPFKDSA